MAADPRALPCRARHACRSPLAGRGRWTETAGISSGSGSTFTDFGVGSSKVKASGSGLGREYTVNVGARAALSEVQGYSSI